MQEISNSNNLGDNCIQNFHLGRYIVGYTVGNLVLQRQLYTSKMKILKMVIPILMHFDLKLERCKPHKAALHPKKGDIIDDVKLFPTVYCRIYCRKFLTLSNPTPRYRSKYIRIDVLTCRLGQASATSF